MDNFAEIYWDGLSLDDKKELLEISNFWCGFITYKYNYLPSTLKEIIVAKMGNKPII